MTRLRYVLVLGVVVVACVGGLATAWVVHQESPAALRSVLAVQAGAVVSLATAVWILLHPTVSRLDQLVEALRSFARGERTTHVDPTDFAGLADVARAVNDVGASLRENDDPNLGPVQRRVREKPLRPPSEEPRPSAVQPDRPIAPRVPPRRPLIEGDEVGEVRRHQRPKPAPSPEPALPTSSTPSSNASSSNAPSSNAPSSNAPSSNASSLNASSSNASSSNAPSSNAPSSNAPSSNAMLAPSSQGPSPNGSPIPTASSGAEPPVLTTPTMTRPAAAAATVVPKSHTPPIASSTTEPRPTDDPVPGSTIGPADSEVPTPATTPPQSITGVEGVSEPRVSRKNRRKAKRAASLASTMRAGSSPDPRVGLSSSEEAQPPPTSSPSSATLVPESSTSQVEAVPNHVAEASPTLIEPAPAAMPTRDDLQRLFSEFLREKRAAGQGETLDVDFDAFAETIVGETERLIVEHRCRGVRFEVAVADGEVSLRPRLLR